MYYHGSHNSLMGTDTAHDGICITDSLSVAENYACGGSVYEIDIELDELNVVECEGYDRDQNYAIADDEGYRAQMAAAGADVLRYEDEDDHGQSLDCFRLVSHRAVDAINAAMTKMD